MEAMCVVCHDQPAAFRCVQCHKPVCDECAFKDDNGAFCSRECAANYRSFKRAETASARRRSGGLLKTLIILLVLAAVALVVAWRQGVLKLPGLEAPGGAPAQQPPEPAGAGGD